MIPLISLDSLRVSWIHISGEGFGLYGFLLYTNADEGIWHYIHHGGMLDLDYLTGEDCAVFVLDQPPPDFVAHAVQKNHVWYRYFAHTGARTTNGGESNGAQVDEEAGENNAGGFSRNILEHLHNCVVVVGHGNQVVAESLLDGPVVDRDELGKVLMHLGLNFGDLPCLVWFTSLDERHFDLVDLQDIADGNAARDFFRRYFTSASFRKLLDVARTEHASS